MCIQTSLLKDVMSRFVTGVTVVTTHYNSACHGMTASSFCSVSLEPPLVLVCIGKHRRSHQYIEKSGVFAVNVLGTDQLDWGKRFAGLGPEISNRFTGIDYKTAVTRSPILPGTLSWVDCKLRHAYDGGDHTIFVGQVVAGGTSENGHPLLYYNRSWRELAAVNAPKTPGALLPIDESAQS